jgi:amidophosphoribosyltransferase
MSKEYGPPNIEQELTHNCAIAGFWFNNPAKNIDPLLLAMIRLQHRGQEGIGVVSINDEGKIDSIIESGHVREVFTDETPANIKARTLINIKMLLGHNRYSTSGDPDAWQPFIDPEIVLAHNGNLVNPGYFLPQLPDNLQDQAKSDTWILHKAILHSEGDNLEEKIVNTVSKAQGAYSLIILDPKTETLFAMRDPWGFRPLYVGQLKDGNGYMVASETVAFQRIAENIQEIKAGQGIKIQNGKVTEFYQDNRVLAPANCIFELIYFSSPASEVFGINADRFRGECGRTLARRDIEEGLIPEVIIPVRNSGVAPTHGYIRETIDYYQDHPEILREKGIKLSDLTSSSGLLTNQYIGRVFIEPGKRSERLKHKFIVNEELIRGKVVVVVDDSIIRGDTTRAIIEILKEAGAKEVHVRISSPPARHPCFMGIDFPTRDQLIAFKKTINQVCQKIGADSLKYLSNEELIAIAQKLNPDSAFCDACFSGKYPLKVDPNLLFSKK